MSSWFQRVILYQSKEKSFLQLLFLFWRWCGLKCQCSGTLKGWCGSKRLRSLVKNVPDCACSEISVPSDRMHNLYLSNLCMSPYLAWITSPVRVVLNLNHALDSLLDAKQKIHLFFWLALLFGEKVNRICSSWIEHNMFFNPTECWHDPTVLLVSHEMV